MSEDGELAALIASLHAAQSEGELHRTMTEFGRVLGCDKVLFGVELRLPALAATHHITSAYPEAYQRLYLERGFIQRDPTVAHCLTHNTPLVWSEHMYESSSYEVMEEARKHGLGHGVSVPVHDGNAPIVSMLSLARDQSFMSPAECTRVVHWAVTLASSLHLAFGRLIVPELRTLRLVHLTPRERECFQYAARGKSNWDIGCILGISESAVAFHVKNVLKKLRVSSRAQAVAIGIAQGLIVL